MSEDKLFVIGVGGTGMRCLESFVHLCAMGMFDNQEINVLILDTDQANGNLKRVKDLIDLYNQIKGSEGGKPSSRTFFSAKLKLSQFSPNYTGGVNYRKMAKLTSQGDQTDNLDLAALFFNEKAQVFDLADGYRAQTHLGSQLMYLAIIEAAKAVKSGVSEPNSPNVQLMNYIEEIGQSPDKSRVFIFGSVFGGTGASSIPVIPRAFNEALKLKSGKSLNGAKFGASLLTEYFKYKPPSDAEKKDIANSVIADSNFFTLNSQAALQFYQNDSTVKSTYKSFYIIGWPAGDVVDFSKGRQEDKTITGGVNQRNACHVTELFCAFAAHDFFNRTSFPTSEAEYLFRSVPRENNSFQFDFGDFEGESNVFKNNLPAFYTVAFFLLLNTFDDIKDEGVSGLLKYDTDYKDEIDELSKKNLTNYFKAFLFKIQKGSVIDGWLFQINSSLNGKFLLPSFAFSDNLSDLKKVNPGDILEDEKSKWGIEKNIIGQIKDVSKNEFFKTFLNPKTQPADIQIPTGSKLEQLLARLYNTITQLQEVN